MTEAPDDHGAYLSLVFGNGRIHGGNAEGNRWMRGRTFEIRAGRQQCTLFVFEGDDGARVDRRGAAAQLWYVQTVTPSFAMSAGMRAPS